MSITKILHLTDTHILSNIKYSGDYIFKHFEEQEYSTLDSLKLVLNRYHESLLDLDGIFITGDLIHEGNEDDYKVLKEYMETRFSVPIYYVLGNHDRTKAFNKAFEYPEEKEEYYYSDILNGIRIIGLDSSHDNSGVGKLSNKQLLWLNEQLEKDREISTVILIHHPIQANLSKSGNKDNNTNHMFLENSKELIDVLKKGNVIGIFSGHTHSNFVNTSQGLTNYVNSGTAFYGEFSNETFTMVNRSALGIVYIDGEDINYNDNFIQEDKKKNLFSFQLNSF